MDVIEYRSEKNKELEESLRKEERNEKRIKLGKKILKITLIVILVISFIFILMHYVGTKGLVVKEYKSLKTFEKVISFNLIVASVNEPSV